MQLAYIEHGLNLSYFDDVISWWRQTASVGTT